MTSFDGKGPQSGERHRTGPLSCPWQGSCCKVPRAACTAARASTVALKLSRKAARRGIPAWLGIELKNQRNQEGENQE